VWRQARDDGLAGSLALLLAVALLVLRPWEGGEPQSGVPATASGRVVRVIDGDTFEVALADGGRDDVRLIGIDTPETVKPNTPVQCYGERASHFTHRLLRGRRVRLVLGVERRDVYGRLLAYVHLGRRLVNALLVRRGLARSLTIPPNDRLAPRFRRLELDAARAGRGLWGACRP
jgi:endonuclease YncB( thermonuclease family)